jgi:flagellar export protein FliJ
MTNKRKKIQKVLELREQTLGKRAGALVQSRTKLMHAVDEAERESQKLAAAAEHRASLAGSVTDVGSWLEAEQWLAHRRNALGRATGKVVKAEAVVQEDFKRVVTARIDKKKIEILDERLAESELRGEMRSEQKLSDEFAQRRRLGERNNG